MPLQRCTRVTVRVVVEPQPASKATSAGDRGGADHEIAFNAFASDCLVVSTPS